MKPIVLVMGVSGCGKSTIARRLAKRLQARFVEADRYHPEANIKKMSAQIALDDQDRLPWLEKLNQVLIDCETAGTAAVLACSALKKNYRDILRQRLRQPLQVVFLEVGKEALVARVAKRPQHFMPAALLDSQLATLEPPTNAFVPVSDQTPDEQVEAIVRWLARNINSQH